jgi:hypothetical protein
MVQPTILFLFHEGFPQNNTGSVWVALPVLFFIRSAFVPRRGRA